VLASGRTPDTRFPPDFELSTAYIPSRSDIPVITMDLALFHMSKDKKIRHFINRTVDIDLAYDPSI
jgi:hypothetical protein